MANFKINKVETDRISKVDYNNLSFGKYFSDHVFVAEYKNGKWNEGEIIPYGPMNVEPAITKEGHVNIFRPDMNAKRLNRSAKMVCIPEYDVETLVEGIKELVKVDQKWIPTERGCSLYIRPVVYGDGNFLGVHASDSYKLIVMTSPVASYYAEGLKPVKILVEKEHVRAVRGGLGSAKTAANYAASLYAGTVAKAKGFAQVLWLDGVERTFIDEVGAMNIMFIIGNELITPSLEQASILAGVTRDSVLTLAREMGMKVSERQITIDEIIAAHKSGELKEVFGTGTAAVISPVGVLHYDGQEMIINNNEIGEISQKFYDTITGIQYGEVEDTHNWNVRVDL
jgi:branched-chain amino acid aminotransferase